MGVENAFLKNYFLCVSFLKLFILCISVFFLNVYICTKCILSDSEIEKRASVPPNWSYRCLWAGWLLGTKPRASASAHDRWTASPALMGGQYLHGEALAWQVQGPGSDPSAVKQTKTNIRKQNKKNIFISKHTIFGDCMVKTFHCIFKVFWLVF